MICSLIAYGSHWSGYIFAVSLAITAEAQDSGAPNDAAWRRADELLKKLTLDEKLQLILSKYPSNASPGGGGGYIEGVTRLHIPDINMSDSSTGSGSTTQPSSTFPATIALAASWDRQLSYDYGSEIAIQLRSQDSQWVLAEVQISQESPEEAEHAST
jgi:beta-glucosidase